MESNKIGNTALISLSDVVIPELVESHLRSKDYVGYGKDNNYPTFLLNLYNDCSDHQSIVDGCVNYVLGNGLIINDQELASFSENVNKDGETLYEVMRKCELDFQIFGGFALKIVKDRLKTLKELYWIDFTTVRTNDDEDKIFISKSWGKWGAQADEYKRFTKELPLGESIYYYKGKKTRGIYPVPLYNASIKPIMTSVKITDFHLNNINTNFNASVILNFNNGVPTEEAKSQIERNIKDKFTGTSADKMLLVFNDNAESGVTIERLESDNFDEKFQSLQKSTQNAIFTGHKVTSPALFGIIIENQGFSKTEFVESFEIYNKTVIAPLQSDITKEFGKVLAPFFSDSTIKIIPFAIEDISIEPQSNNE
jgi:hypothetical protein